MYKIIGVDQKEYGPITGEQIRFWITEGRVNANTQARAEGATNWQPLSAFAEFADVFGVAAAPAFTSGTTGQAASAEQILARDYNLDIGSCLARSWVLVKNNLWPVVGVSTLVLFLSAVINQIFSLFTRSAVQEMILQHRVSPKAIVLVVLVGIITAPVYSVLFGGLLKYYLKLIRAEGPTVADAFAGFGPSLGQLLLLGLVQGVLTNLGFVFCILPGLYLAVSWYFALPLVIDRNIGFWDAMELSRKVVSKHWFLVFAFFLVMGLISACGIIVCCVGILVSLPVGLVALMYAYEDLFQRQTP